MIIIMRKYNLSNTAQKNIYKQKLLLRTRPKLMFINKFECHDCFSTVYIWNFRRIDIVNEMCKLVYMCSKAGLIVAFELMYLTHRIFRRKFGRVK